MSHSLFEDIERGAFNYRPTDIIIPGIIGGITIGSPDSSRDIRSAYSINHSHFGCSCFITFGQSWGQRLVRVPVAVQPAVPSIIVTRPVLRPN